MCSASLSGRISFQQMCFCIRTYKNSSQENQICCWEIREPKIGSIDKKVNYKVERELKGGMRKGIKCILWRGWLVPCVCLQFFPQKKYNNLKPLRFNFKEYKPSWNQQSVLNFSIWFWQLLLEIFSSAAKIQ